MIYDTPGHLTEVKQVLVEQRADSWWLDCRPMTGYDRYLQEMGGKYKKTRLG